MRIFQTVPRSRISVAFLVVALATTGCDTDSLLEVSDPDVTLPPALLDSTNVAVVRAYAIGEFAIAFSGYSAGETAGVVGAGGLLADELYHSGTYQQNREVDKRRITEHNSTLDLLFLDLHQARRAAEFAAEVHADLRPGTADLAEMHNLAGYTYVFFAENFCSGVPFSEQVDGAFVFGERETTAQILDRADARFAAARTAVSSASGTDATNQDRLARMGAARVLLNEDDHAAAAALVTGIPTTWSYVVEYSDNTTRQNNGIFSITQSRREYGIADTQGGNGIDFRRSPEDARAPWRFDGASIDGITAQFTPVKYDERTTPVVLASGIEARLIEAEVALNGGASPAYLVILNTLRLDYGISGVLVDPGPAARVDQFFEERALWLHLTGQRLPDLRRLVRQYGRSEDAVFPTGTYTRPSADGGTQTEPVGFGTDVNFPLPFAESNNPLPNSAECLSRDA